MPPPPATLSLRRRLATGLDRLVADRVAAGGVAEAPAVAPAVALEWSDRPDHGDLASNCGFQLARQLRMAPPLLAGEIADAFNGDSELGPLARAAAIGGYVNLRLADEVRTRELPLVITSGSDYGRSELGGGQTVQVEFVSVNPTGPLHVAHGRHAAIGDSLARILEFTGHRVTREFYSNDTGNQVLLFGESILVRWLESQGAEAVIPEGGYQGDYVRELAQAAGGQFGPELEAIREGAPRDPLIPSLATFGVARMEDAFRDLLGRIGVRFDSWFSEATLYQDDWESETLARLRGRGAVVERDGALWLTTGPDDEGFVIYKTDGQPTYTLKDILYHRDKLERRAFALVIDLLGADHHGEAQRVRDGLAALDIDTSRLEVLLLQFVHLRRGGESVKMSKRSGDFEALADLVDEVGADAVRYMFLMRTPDSSMEFDIDLALSQSNENPVFYAQYASARLHNVLALAGAAAEASPESADLSRLDTEWELDLIRDVLRFPDLVEEAAVRREPHRLAFFCAELAAHIHVFYRNCRILGSEPAEEAARLVLCRAALTVLRNALGLVGVTAPTRM